MLEVNFLPFPVLKTERLVLRRVVDNDAETILALRSNEEVMKYIPRPYLKNKEDALELIAMFDDKIENGIGINWGIAFLDKPEKIIGIIGHYRMKPEHYRAEVGYMLFPEYNGKGIISEALQRVVDYGFKDMKLHSIEAILDPENTGSEKVLLKNGFVKEAHLIENEYYEGRFLDTMIYSKLNK
ncbi:GNAT family N-acetyltransferase [Flavobacterium aquicola]|uniref:Ribosomal-protein-alanine N-acetyltransferase n=1 Tax=Flavobacterium aquicola TaxID=1682742 RepID=A0A3E0ERT7_9FLAO|nr:GNAT family N-acetyltransferase [Flavobacterium aquicola]REH00859.1 ribosomal-protein-alanine N-acetyltransferase [Flavobacterium aquicola]